MNKQCLVICECYREMLVSYHEAIVESIKAITDNINVSEDVLTRDIVSDMMDHASNMNLLIRQVDRKIEKLKVKEA